MCGIAGIIHRNGSSPIGDEMTSMLQAMKHRGPDSTGFALYGAPTEEWVMRVKLADANTPRDFDFDERLARNRAEVQRRLRAMGARFDGIEELNPTTFDVRVAYDADDLKALVDQVEDVSRDAEVLSLGHSLEIVKDAGGAAEVDARHHISRFRGTHGLGHVRLATESITAVAYGHPFWAEPFPDVSIVHNGQLTNYYTLRRLLEHDGFRFQTGNDSELIAVYLADKMSRGQTFYEALKDSVYELDGCFAYLLSMPDVIGSAKDMFAIKSIVVANVGGDTAMATEEQAIRAVYTDELDDTQHPDPRSVFVWERSGRVLQEIV